jgi:hypothetical protein
MAYQYVGTNTRPILNDDPYKRNQQGILDAQVGWETMQLMPYGARMAAYKQHPNMSMQQIAQMRAQQSLQGQQQMQPTNSGVPPLLKRPYTAADVPSLGAGGPLTKSAMDAASGISQRPALSANGQQNFVMQQQPVLSIGGQNVTQPFASEQAVLADPSIASSTVETPVTGKSQETGNRRDGTPVGQANPAQVKPEKDYSRLAERLIRMGGAMNANAHLGGNAMLGAMAQQQGMILNEEEAQRNAEADRQLSALSTYQDAIQEQQTLLGDLDMQDRKLADAFDKFNQFGNNVTGVYDSTIMSGWDNLPFGDPKREAFRTELKAIMVDETLLRTANTKGAISDKEMALFQSAVPSMNQSEEVWKAWIEARRENIAVIRNRLRNGITVSRDADIGFKNTYKAPVESAVQQQGSGTTASAFSDDELSEIENNL